MPHVKTRHQPPAEWWDATNAAWWASDNLPPPEHNATLLAHDGEWIVQRGCLDCRVMFYADFEYVPHESPTAPCPQCGGTRIENVALSMDRRPMKVDDAPFGTVECDLQRWAQ